MDADAKEVIEKLKSLGMTKTYLGDAVYVDWNGKHYVLTTENNTIFLDPDVINAFWTFVKQVESFKKIGVR